MFIDDYQLALREANEVVGGYIDLLIRDMPPNDVLERLPPGEGGGSRSLGRPEGLTGRVLLVDGMPPRDLAVDCSTRRSNVNLCSSFRAKLSQMFTFARQIVSGH